MEDDVVCYYCGEGLAKEGPVNEYSTEAGSVQKVNEWSWRGLEWSLRTVIEGRNLLG